MNAERLHAIVLDLKDELDSKTLDERLQRIVETLGQVVRQNNSGAQQNLATALIDFRASLANSRSDTYSPTWRQILEEIGAAGLCGRELLAKVNATLERNSITPAVAHQELQTIHTTFKALKVALDQISSGFAELEIGAEELAPGECEVGVLIPRQAINNKLSEFTEELRELNFILGTFAEVTGGQKEDFTIKTISSSDLLLYFETSLPYAACLAVAVERIVALYKQILEIRELHSKLVSQGVPAARIEPVQEYANEVMSTGVDKLADAIVDQHYTKKDTGRKNELKVAVRFALNKIANRIDKGFSIEVRVEKHTENKPATNEAEAQAVQAILTATANIKLSRVTGSSILALPESADSKAKKK